MELGPEDVSLLERCPHFRGCYVQSSMELGPVPIREVSSFQRVLCTVLKGPEDAFPMACTYMYIVHVHVHVP